MKVQLVLNVTKVVASDKKDFDDAGEVTHMYTSPDFQEKLRLLEESQPLLASKIGTYA